MLEKFQIINILDTFNLKRKSLEKIYSVTLNVKRLKMLRKNVFEKLFNLNNFIT